MAQIIGRAEIAASGSGQELDGHPKNTRSSCRGGDLWGGSGGSRCRSGLIVIRACIGPGGTGADRRDGIPDRLGHGQGVLASRHRGGNGVSLVLVRSGRHAA